jgi:hypothetical protein
MEWIIVLIIALFLFSKSGGSGSLSIQAGTSPVINNATGGSLSGALGSQAQPPSYYSSGNPGYNTQQPPVVQTPILVKNPVLKITRPIFGPVYGNGGQPIIATNLINRPENTSPVWSKMLIRPIESNLQ